MRKKIKWFMLSLCLIFFLQSISMEAIPRLRNSVLAVEAVVDDQAPTIPLNLTIDFKDGLKVKLIWDNATDNVGVIGYGVYRNGIKIGFSNDNFYIDTIPENNDSYDYYVIALDIQGNMSGESNHIIINDSHSKDTEAPTTPLNLMYSMTMEDAIQLSWTASTDNTGVVGYEVYNHDKKIGYTGKINFIDPEVVFGITNIYTIIAYDAAGNSSQVSEPLIVTLTEGDTLGNNTNLSDYVDPKEYKTDRYIVKYKSQLGSNKIKEYLKDSLKRTSMLDSKRKDKDIEVIQLKNKVKPDDFISNIKNKKSNEAADFEFNEVIEYIQPDYQFVSSSLDPYFNQQWGIYNPNDNTIQTDIPIDYEYDNEKSFRIDANVPDAWSITKGGGTTVAVLDTGIDITQEDLRDNIWVNRGEVPDNQIDDDGNGYIDDVYGWNFCDMSNRVHEQNNINDEWHGTNIAGIIAAQQDNNLGITGVAPDTKIMVLKVFKNGIAYTSDIINAIEYAEKMGARIANCSWGSTDNNPALKEAINNSNMLFVCAAGNSHIDIDNFPIYPAAFDYANVITVASIDRFGILSSFSNYGENTVDVTAPGEDIISTYPSNNYSTTSGTSMSAAFVSGEAALLLYHIENMNITSMRERIISSSDRLSSLQGKIHNGNKINCNNAMMNIVTNKIVQINSLDNNSYSTINNQNQSGYTLFSNGTWATKANLPASLHGLKAVEVNGKIYTAGGWYTNSLYQYDPLTNSWSAKAGMQISRAGHSIAAVNGKIYVIGGYNGSFLNSVEEYNPATNTWTTKASMPTARDGVCAAVVNNIIYVMGGFNGNNLNTVEAYDPSTNTWSTKPNMLTARRTAAATSISGKIYIAGGWFTNSMEMYDPVNNNWTLKASMSTWRGDHDIVNIYDKLYAIGGYNGSLLNTVDEYQPLTNTWSSCPNMPTARSLTGAATVNNTMYVIGGTNGTVDYNVVEAYTPVLETNTTTRSLLHMDGSDGNTSFKDETGRSWTANGNAQIDTAQSKFGGASGLFDGIGDYISTPDSDGFNLSNENFTIDFWVRLTVTQNLQFIFSQRSGYGNNHAYNLYINYSNLHFAYTTNGTNVIDQGFNFTFNTNTWYHIAIVRDKTEIKCYINGVQDSNKINISTNSIYDSSAFFCLGNAINDQGQGLQGWIDEFRISKGISRWTSNFAPPTAPYSKEQSINDYVDYVLDVSNMQSFSGHSFTVTYNPNEVKIEDLCSFTYIKETNVGLIAGTGINITQLTSGSITFVVDITVPQGKTWSGVINCIKFKLISSTRQPTLTYSIM